MQAYWVVKGGLSAQVEWHIRLRWARPPLYLKPQALAETLSAVLIKFYCFYAGEQGKGGKNYYAPQGQMRQPKLQGKLGTS